MAGADGKTLAVSPLTIPPSRARLEVPRRVAAREEFEVSWNGPNSNGDRIVLVKAGTREGSYFSSSAYSQSTQVGSPVKLKAFPAAGAYEVRYLAGGDGKTLARSMLQIYVQVSPRDTSSSTVFSEEKNSFKRWFSRSRVTTVPKL